VSLQTTITDIENERHYQEEKWGIVNDDNNTLDDWLRYISKYVLKASGGSNHLETRRRLVQVAALAVAAVESCDRNLGFPEPVGVAFDA
jgi:hypothetical protein